MLCRVRTQTLWRRGGGSLDGNVLPPYRLFSDLEWTRDTRAKCLEQAWAVTLDLRGFFPSRRQQLDERDPVVQACAAQIDAFVATVHQRLTTVPSRSAGCPR